uniref:Amino acid transporter transmembrane domain-containing protein n=1 Tax=Oryza meridionalis TaxID=40149 RepID=A0A0E0CD72_9ORYZ
MKWLSGVIDNTLYPVLFLDYLKSGVPALGGGVPRAFAIIGLTAVLTLLNYRGLTVVRWVAICLGVFSLLPFFVMGLIALPKLRAARWLVIDLHNVDCNLYLNTLFWNLNYWDSINTLAGEVKNPGKTLPKALFYAVIFVVVAYLYPLLAGTGAVSLNRGQWTDGYFADITKLLGDAWLMWWVQSAAALSNMGIFVAEMSSDSYQLLGMAERGMLPRPPALSPPPPPLQPVSPARRRSPRTPTATSLRRPPTRGSGPPTAAAAAVAAGPCPSAAARRRERERREDEWFMWAHMSVGPTHTFGR